MNSDLTQEIGRLQKRYIAAALLLGLLTVTAVALHKYETACGATVKGLQAAKGNLRQMREANGNILATLRRLDTLFPPQLASLSSEQLLYKRLDEIKLLFRGADITIGSIEDQGDHQAITFGIKGEMQNFQLFLNAIGDMEQTILPIVQIRSLHIAQEEIQQRLAISYQVDGQLRFPVQSSPTQQSQ